MMLLHHSNGMLSDFRGKLIRFVHGSIFIKCWSLLKTRGDSIRPTDQTFATILQARQLARIVCYREWYYISSVRFVEGQKARTHFVADSSH